MANVQSTMVAGTVRSLEQSVWSKPHLPLVTVNVTLVGNNGSARIDVPQAYAHLYMIGTDVSITIRPCIAPGTGVIENG